ncbi:hypothetical protein BDK51DRAFT_45418 [Blyttiomyces helicus]|uniref:Uncharacterized protein n=1 Tax=Blyttiomyces helicus TaxID=388810 RepID=A0A4P9WIX1_9FUNG|nr:hypothetical protein BDK51DRAFT_45418 [Blyttiomyces helicus]|eukprot:RKO92849.1 hypothetical protein BDK51DRAFT_45418 [Blyttiomyces helicus]
MRLKASYRYRRNMLRSRRELQRRVALRDDPLAAIEQIGETLDTTAGATQQRQTGATPPLSNSTSPNESINQNLVPKQAALALESSETDASTSEASSMPSLLATLNSIVDNDRETFRRNSILKAKDRIASLLEARASGGHELAPANEEIQRVLDRFQMDKIGDLRSMMLAYALAQREYHRKATGTWEEAMRRLRGLRLRSRGGAGRRGATDAYLTLCTWFLTLPWCFFLPPLSNVQAFLLARWVFVFFFHPLLDPSLERRVQPVTREDAIFASLWHLATVHFREGTLIALEKQEEVRTRQLQKNQGKLSDAFIRARNRRKIRDDPGVHTFLDFVKEVNKKNVKTGHETVNKGSCHLKRLALGSNPSSATGTCVCRLVGCACDIPAMSSTTATNHISRSLRPGRRLLQRIPLAPVWRGLQNRRLTNARLPEIVTREDKVLTCEIEDGATQVTPIVFLTDQTPMTWSGPMRKFAERGHLTLATDIPLAKIPGVVDDVGDALVDDSLFDPFIPSYDKALRTITKPLPAPPLLIAHNLHTLTLLRFLESHPSAGAVLVCPFPLAPPHTPTPTPPLHSRALSSFWAAPSKLESCADTRFPMLAVGFNEAQIMEVEERFGCEVEILDDGVFGNAEVDELFVAVVANWMDARIR